MHRNGGLNILNGYLEDVEGPRIELELKTVMRDSSRRSPRWTETWAAGVAVEGMGLLTMLGDWHGIGKAWEYKRAMELYDMKAEFEFEKSFSHRW